MHEKNDLGEVDSIEDENLTDENEEEIVVDTLLKKEKKKNKHLKAVGLVEKAKQIVKEADEQTVGCKLLLADDLKEYEEAKNSLRDNGYESCKYLLEKFGYKDAFNGNNDENTLVFSTKEDIPPILLKDVRSGKFTGFVYALFAGVLTATGLVYLATEKLGMTLDISKIPSQETTNTILSWFGNSVGMDSNPYIGAAILGTAILSVMTIVYLTRVMLKGSKNLNFAVKQYVEAELYTEYKNDCKKEMDKVDAHMKETVDTLKMYEVLFTEQKGKLERILHIEGEKSQSTDYHEKSFLEIRDTKELIRVVKDFISIPMSKEGKLSEESVASLKRVKAQMNKMLERLY